MAWIYFFVQLILCYPATMLLVAPLSKLLEQFGWSGDLPRHVHFAGYEALLCLFVAPLVGWITGLERQLIPSGRWTWVPPVLLRVPSAIYSAFQPPLDPRYLPDELFTLSGSEGLGVALFTLPACCAIGYSLGIWLRSIRRPRTAVAFAAVAEVAVAAFVGSATLMHRYEIAKLESLSRMRVVHGFKGLHFSTDPNVLCTSSPSPSLPFLERLDPVESIETRMCGAGRLLDRGATEPPNSFSIEKLRFLDGPNAGRTIWVPSYGVEPAYPPELIPR